MGNFTILFSVPLKMACSPHNRTTETVAGRWLNVPLHCVALIYFLVHEALIFLHGSRKLYWSDHGTDSGVPAKIASANMDGTSLKILFTGNMEHLEVVTLDIQEQKLYWAVTSRGVVRAALVFTICSVKERLCGSERAEFSAA